MKFTTKVLKNKTLNKNNDVLELILELPKSYPTTIKPGQFVEVYLESSEVFLPRPLSIANTENRTLSLIYKVVGKGTDIMRELKVDDEVVISKPLGNEFPKPDAETVILVAGGIGIPPIYYLAKSLGTNYNIHVCLGFNSVEDVFYEEKFNRLPLSSLKIATMDGTQGVCGTSVDLVKDIDDKGIIYSCGPTVMLKALEESNRECKGYVSCEARMACGYGACYGCVINTIEGMKRVCKDGPVFPFGVIIYD